MDQILAKIVNLSYELLGIYLPGFIFGLFILLVWWGVGDLPPVLTHGAVPSLTLDWIDAVVKKLDVKLGIGIAIPGVICSYFLGTFLVWVSRSGRADANSKWTHLLASSLLMKIPKPQHSYEPALGALFDKVRLRFSDASNPLDWRMFYPVGKAYLARNAAHSLVTTYQNKYTFHRSLVLSSAISFWLSVSALVLGGITSHFCRVEPKWMLLSVMAACWLWMVNGFTGSYRFHWQMFGNTIITELYSLLFGPELKANESK